MSDDSDSFAVNGDDSTGPISDSGNHTNPADPTVPDHHARSRRFDFRGKIGNFLIHREIGRGGMGVVYEAIEEILNRRVALKVLPSVALIDEMQIRRFRNEAAAAAQLVHPNIVPVYSVGSDRGVHYYAMQLIDGQNIAEIIGSIRERISTEDKAKHNADTPRDIGTTQRATEAPAPAVKGSKDSSSRKQLMEDDFAAAVSHHRHPQSCQRLFKSIASIGCDAARAIHYAHDAGVVHRDIKPHNLMLDEKGKVWITDFGLAQVRDNPVGTRTGDILGTLKYMSPEQASGRKFLIDHRTDIYSLGVTLYELLTLKPAHSGIGAKEILRQISFEDPQSLRLINPRIPAELETIIAKSIAKNPQERYETAAEFADDLERFCNDQPIAARRPTIVQKARRWVIKNPTMAGMAGVGMVFTFLTSLGITGAMVSSNQTISMEREKAVSLLSKSEGWRLLTHSRIELPKNPGVGLALAMEGAKRVEGLEANLAVQDAFNASHEQYNFQPRKEATANIEVANRSQRAVLTVDSQFVGKGNYPAIVIDLKNTKTLFQLDSGEAITSAAYSPNEEFLLTTSSSPTLPAGVEQEASQLFAPIVWDAANGRRLSAFPQHAIPEVHTEMFSPDSANIVLPGPGNQASIYNTQTFGIIAVLRGHDHSVVRAAYSPDGKWIATVDNSGEARFWTASDGQLVKSMAPQPDGKIHQFQFSKDSNRLLVASKTGTRVYGVNGESTEPEAFWREPRFKMSPQKDRCASYWDFGKVVEIRDLSDGRSILRIETQDHVTTVTFSSDGQYLVIGSGNRFSMHDAATGLKLSEFLGHTDKVTCARFNKTEGTIVTSANDRTVRTWYPKSGWERYTFGSLSDGRGVANIAFSTDSRYMLSNSCMDFQTIMFDANGNRINGNQHGELISDHLLAGNLILGSSAVSIVDPVTSRIAVSRKFSGQSVRDVIPIGRSRSAIVRLQGDTSVLWNTATDEVTPLTERGDQVVCYDVLPDGTKFLIGTANGKCQLHDATNGAILRTVLHPSLVSCVRFLPIDQRMVTIDERSTIRVWGEDTLAAVRTLAKENYSFTACLISSDSKSLISFHESKSQPICCWDIDTGQLRFETAGPRAAKVVLHSGSPLVYCGSVANGLFAWNFDTGERIDVSSAPVLEIALLADRILAIEMPTATNFENAEFMLRPNTKASVIGVYTTQTNQKLMEIPATEGLHRNRISINEATQEFAISTMIHSVKLVDRTNSDSAVWLGAHRAPISFAGFAGESNRVVTASWDGAAKIWRDGNLLVKTLVESGEPITAGALTSDGSTLALGFQNGTIELWNTSSGERLARFEGTQQVTQLAFDEKSQNLLSTDLSGIVRVWNLISRKSTVIKNQPGSCAAVLSRDSRFVLLYNTYTKTNSGTTTGETQPRANVIVHALATGIDRAIPNTSGAVAGTISSDSSQLALVYEDGSVGLFKLSQDGLADSQRKLVLPGQKFTNCCFSASGKLLATATDHGLSLWNVATGNEQHRILLDANASLLSVDTVRGETWNPFSHDERWFGLNSMEKILVRPVNSPKAAAELEVRALTQFEKEQFRVGLDELVDVQSD